MFTCVSNHGYKDLISEVLDMLLGASTRYLLYQLVLQQKTKPDDAASITCFCASADLPCSGASAAAKGILVSIIA